MGTSLLNFNFGEEFAAIEPDHVMKWKAEGKKFSFSSFICEIIYFVTFVIPNLI